jgi:L-histidine Nalpha-methyltransferase / hercynylcysteine S-oxide synthase
MEQSHYSNRQLTLAQNSHLVNNGVEETPPASKPTQADGDAAKKDDVYIDLEGANVGFTRWHPTPVTVNGNRLAGQAEMGGVWEWTSTPLAKHEGFIPESLYPQYTCKHGRVRT